MPKQLPQDGFIYSLRPDDDSVKRWSFTMGGVRYYGEANNVVPPAGAHGSRWSRQESGLLPPEAKPDKRKLHEILAELREFGHIKGVRFPLRQKPPPKASVQYVSGLVEAAKARLVRRNLLEGICKHGALFPFRSRAPPTPPLPLCFIEDEPTIRALNFDYQVDGPDGEW